MYCSDCCLFFLWSRLIPYYCIQCLRTREKGNMLMDVNHMNSILEMVAASRNLIENTVWLVSSHFISGNYIRQLRGTAVIWNWCLRTCHQGFCRMFLFVLPLSDTACIICVVRHCAPSILCRTNPEFILESRFSSHLCIIKCLPCHSGFLLNFVH